MEVKFKKKGFCVHVARGVKQVVGLMFQKPKPLLFPTNGKKVDMHTFFCFSMDIYWIRQGKIVKKAEAKPFKIYPGTFADYVLETPKGFLNAEEGDRIIIKGTPRDKGGLRSF